MEYLFAHSMHGPSAFFGFGLFMLAIPMAMMVVKRSRARDKQNAISAQLGAQKYQAYLEAQAKSAAEDPSNGASSSNGAASTPLLANSYGQKASQP